MRRAHASIQGVRMTFTSKAAKALIAFFIITAAAPALAAPNWDVISENRSGCRWELDIDSITKSDNGRGLSFIVCPKPITRIGNTNLQLAFDFDNSTYVDAYLTVIIKNEEKNIYTILPYVGGYEIKNLPERDIIAPKGSIIELCAQRAKLYANGEIEVKPAAKPAAPKSKPAEAKAAKPAAKAKLKSKPTKPKPQNKPAVKPKPAAQPKPAPKRVGPPPGF